MNLHITVSEHVLKPKESPADLQAWKKELMKEVRQLLKKESEGLKKETHELLKKESEGLKKENQELLKKESEALKKENQRHKKLDSKLDQIIQYLNSRGTFKLLYTIT